MDFQRAKQILQAEETFTVLHQGAPVWIESLNVGNDTVKVRPVNGQGEVKEVPVVELVEG